MPVQVSDTKQNDVQQVSAEVLRKAAAEELYGLPVDTAVAFFNRKGLYNRSIERRQRKFLKKLCFLAPFFEGGERILFVTTGCSPTSSVEQLFTGAPLHPLKCSLFVLTDRRVLHIPTTINHRYRGSVAQIPYADCRQLRIRGSTLIARYKSGRTERFPCIAFIGRSKVKAILKSASLEGRASPVFERSHLCPRCTNPLIKNYYSCPQCSLKFKNKAWATLFSIIFPGGGYFYARHPFLGIFAGAMEGVFVFLIVVAAGLLSISFPNVPEGLYQAIAVCAIVLVLEKLSAVMFSGKCIAEFIPQKRHVKVQTDLLETQRSQPKPEEMLSTGWRSR